MRYKRISEISSSSNGGLPCSRQNSLSTFLKAWELSSLVQKTRYYTEEKFIEVSLNSTHSPPLSFSLIRMWHRSRKACRKQKPRGGKIDTAIIIEIYKAGIQVPTKEKGCNKYLGFSVLKPKRLYPRRKVNSKKTETSTLAPVHAKDWNPVWKQLNFNELCR